MGTRHPRLLLLLPLLLAAAAALRPGLAATATAPWPRRLPPGSACAAAAPPLEAARARCAALTGVETRLPSHAPGGLLARAEDGLGSSPPGRDDGGVVVNLGQGGTGTHSAWVTLAAVAPGLHLDKLSGPTPKNATAAAALGGRAAAAAAAAAAARRAASREVAAAWGAMHACARRSWRRAGDGGVSCGAEALGRRVVAALAGALSAPGLAHVGDVPWAHFLAELMRLREARAARFLQTLREPGAWAADRVKKHPGSVVCRPQFAANASSWFSLGECLTAAGDGALAWETLATAGARDAAEMGAARRHERLAAKYAHHAASVAAAVGGGRLRQVCLWDGGDQSGLLGVRVGRGVVAQVLRAAHSWRGGRHRVVSKAAE